MFKNILIFISLTTIIILSRSLYITDKKFRITKEELMTERSSCAFEMFDLARMTEKRSIVLYQLMKDVDMVLRHHKITYWADGGTLLGALRHKGVIPYDDDLDIQVNIDDKERLKLAIKDLEKLGYTTGGSDVWYQIMSTDSCSREENHIDIFLMHVGNTTTQYADKIAEKNWGAGAPPRKEEIYPVKEADFGEIKIFVPNDPIPYLTRYFGKDFMQRGCIISQHSNKSIKKTRCLQLEGKMLEPSTPTGPLQDRSNLLGY